jgi:hypothetical protein
LAGYGITDAYTKTAIDEMEQALQQDIDDNARAINAINNAETGILKQAKDYTDTEIGKLDFYSTGETDQEITDAINSLKTTVISPLSEEVAKKASQTDLNAVSAVANAAATQTALAEEIARAKGEESRIEGLVTAEADRAKGIESGLRTDVDAIKGDYLKAADKTELSNAITAEKERAEGVEAGL